MESQALSKKLRLLVSSGRNSVVCPGVMLQRHPAPYYHLGRTQVLAVNRQARAVHRRPNDILCSLNRSFSCTSPLGLQPTPESPTVWLAIGAAIGLPVALWLYKTAMLVLFQRKIIYMGYLPPDSRTEEVADVKIPKGITCQEISVPSDGGVTLFGIVLRPAQNAPGTKQKPPETVIVYLQGNTGNPLARIPVFARLLENRHLGQTQHDVAIVAAAPRSYWKSSPKTPTEKGLKADYRHILSYVSHEYSSSSIVLYGHSIGGAIAVCLTADLEASDYPNVKGLILENPFSSIPDMVRALYPQKWLPYYYCAPLAFDKWDAVAAVQAAQHDRSSLLHRLSKRMLVLLSEKDEIVPTSMGEQIFSSCTDTDVNAVDSGDTDSNQLRRCVFIRDALHEHAWKERQWLTEMRAYLDGVQLARN